MKASKLIKILAKNIALYGDGKVTNSNGFSIANIDCVHHKGKMFYYADARADSAALS